MPYQHVVLDIKEGVGHLTLNRADSANSINLELAKDLMYTLFDCEKSPDVRSMLITGAGKCFVQAET